MKTGLLIGMLLVAHMFGVHRQGAAHLFAAQQEAALPGDRTMYDLISQAERHAEQGNWQNVRECAERLEERVRRRFWMLQLLGDEEEYESLQRDLAQLQFAVRERSRMNALLLLADIRSILDHIFSL